MHINSAERSIICKVCYYGPVTADTAEILRHLYRHYSATHGEHTAFEERQFALREELAESMSADEVEEFVTHAEESMGASYEELVDAGELVWFRTRLAPATSPDQFDVYVDAFTVSGGAYDGVFGALAMRDADGVVFVADPCEREDTLASWESLREQWDGPTVLFVVDADDTEEIAEWLGHEGPAYAEGDGFEHMLATFQDAAKVAVQHARSAN